MIRKTGKFLLFLMLFMFPFGLNYFDNNIFSLSEPLFTSIFYFWWAFLLIVLMKRITPLLNINYKIVRRTLFYLVLFISPFALVYFDVPILSISISEPFFQNLLGETGLGIILLLSPWATLLILFIRDIKPFIFPIEIDSVKHFKQLESVFELRNSSDPKNDSNKVGWTIVLLLILPVVLLIIHQIIFLDSNRNDLIHDWLPILGFLPWLLVIFIALTPFRIVLRREDERTGLEVLPLLLYIKEGMRRGFAGLREVQRENHIIAMHELDMKRKRKEKIISSYEKRIKR